MIGMQTLFASNAIQNPEQKAGTEPPSMMHLGRKMLGSLHAAPAWHPPVCSYSERHPSFHSIHQLNLNEIGKHFSA